MKKKVASRSAMTLKDFHGGSIPSDLPLPSAPGMTVDRSAFERQGSGAWMSPTLGRGYSNDRSAYHRQGSSTGLRTLEDKAAYFPNPANIGRNYDEDERKPVGDSRPRSGPGADRFDDHAYEERRGGAYPVDRCVLEDQANYSEPRGSAAPDRFPPSQVAGGRFETTENFVHDDFGLIPVGPPPSRVHPSQEVLPRSQPSGYQREMVPETRYEQSSYVQIQQQTASAQQQYSPQIAASPPRSWRNPSQHVQQSSAPAALSHLPSESGTNVWTARRDGGDYNRTQAAEVTSDSQNSGPWRPQSLGGRAVDKVLSGKWQADSSRPSSGRWQTDSSRESFQKPSGAEEQSAGYGAYGGDNGRQSHSEDYSDSRRFSGTDPERVGYPGTGRAAYVDSKGSNYVDGRPDLVDQSKAGYRDVNRGGFGSGGIGGTSSNGRYLPSEPSIHSTGERSWYSDAPDNSLPTATETGRESSQPEITERPKLKLLPRSKPLEKIESPTAESENAVGYEESTRKVHGLPEAPYQDGAIPKREPGGTNDETDEDRKVERPKLNLKPRSAPPEAEVEGSQKVRQLVFGGARPRELVLKERGVDDVVSNGTLDGAPTPGTASVLSPANSGKYELSNAIKMQRSDSRSEEKLDNRYERPERPYDRQGSHRTERQDSGRADWSDGKWDLEKESQWEQERPDGRRRDFDRQDSRRDTDGRRDIDKQESWRRPAESPVCNIGMQNSPTGLSSLVDPSPRGPGRYAPGSAASAVELAQAFSRSSSLGSTMTGSARAPMRTTLSPLPKTTVQGFAPGYGNGTTARDAPFSRLAEASPPPYSALSAEFSGLGLDAQSGYFGGGKLSGYGSNDLKRGSSFGRAEIGRDFMEETGDFPGKRGLPMRQRDGYFD